MQKIVKLQNLSLSYSLKRNRRSKNVRLIIHNDGTLVVTAPKWVSIRFIEGFLTEKAPWITKELGGAKMEDRELAIREEKDRYKQFKKEALVFVQEKLALHNYLYELSYNKVIIRNQRSRWGSCSSQGNLSFNFKILFLPDHLADYLIVHELCHLQEMNHSERFWALVGRSVPDYANKIKELRKYEQLSL